MSTPDGLTAADVPTFNKEQVMRPYATRGYGIVAPSNADVDTSTVQVETYGGETKTAQVAQFDDPLETVMEIYGDSYRHADKRSLTGYTKFVPMDWMLAGAMIGRIPHYNAFDPLSVLYAFESRSDMIAVARESSVALYVLTADLDGLIDTIESIGAQRDGDRWSGGPDELGVFPDYDGYPPDGGIGHDPDCIDTSDPVLVRAWWD